MPETTTAETIIETKTEATTAAVIESTQDPEGSSQGFDEYKEKPIRTIASASPVVTTSQAVDNPNHISKWFGDIQLTEDEARAFVKFLNSDSSIEKIQAKMVFQDRMDLALKNIDEYSIEIDTLNQMIDMGIEIDPASYMEQIIHYVDLAYELIKMDYTTLLCSFLYFFELGDSLTLEHHIENSKTVVDVNTLSISIKDTLATAILNGYSVEAMRDKIKPDIEYIDKIIADIKARLRAKEETLESLRGD